MGGCGGEAKRHELSEEGDEVVVGGGSQFLTQLVMGSGVSQSLCWPVSGQGQDPAGPRVGSDLSCGIVVFLLPLSVLWQVKLV